MHLIDRYGYPYEKRIGWSVHNFVRACVLLLRGQLRLRRGEFRWRGHSIALPMPVFGTNAVVSKTVMTWLEPAAEEHTPEVTERALKKMFD